MTHCTNSTQKVNPVRLNTEALQSVGSDYRVNEYGDMTAVLRLVYPYPDTGRAVLSLLGIDRVYAALEFDTAGNISDGITASVYGTASSNFQRAAVLLDAPRGARTQRITAFKMRGNDEALFFTEWSNADRGRLEQQRTAPVHRHHRNLLERLETDREITTAVHYSVFDALHLEQTLLNAELLEQIRAKRAVRVV